MLDISPAAAAPFINEHIFQNKISSFNDDYYCKIESLEINDEEIKIYIDMHGNSSLGKIQNPNESLLIIRTQSEEERNINFLYSNFVYEDPYNGYKGYLCYENILNDNEKSFIEGKLYFKFGENGYSDEYLIDIDKIK